MMVLCVASGSGSGMLSHDWMPVAAMIAVRAMSGRMIEAACPILSDAFMLFAFNAQLGGGLAPVFSAVFCKVCR